MGYMEMTAPGRPIQDKREVKAMTSHRARVLTDRDRGICSSCDHFLTCRLHSGEDDPVLFCDEFACTSERSQERRREDYALPGQYEGRLVVRKSESGRAAFIGLCRTCGKLATCTLLKPGGGTWRCEFYEEEKK